MLGTDIVIVAASLGPIVAYQRGVLAVVNRRVGAVGSLPAFKCKRIHAYGARVDTVSPKVTTFLQKHNLINYLKSRLR
jgi:hypothetical protein